MYVDEFQQTTIGKGMLRYTDEDTDNRELLYTVTEPLTELSSGADLLDFGKAFNFCALRRRRLSPRSLHYLAAPALSLCILRTRSCGTAKQSRSFAVLISVYGHMSSNV